MNVRCDDCGKEYDDAERDTGCPHERFLSVEDQARKDMAISLIVAGRPIRFAHQPDGPTHRIQAVNWIGMVTLDDLPGEFAPHLFVAAES